MTDQSNACFTSKYAVNKHAPFLCMAEKYDIVIIGTGLSECILSTILSQAGYAVLQLDSSDRYGTSLQTFNYIDLCKHFKKSSISFLAAQSRQFNIDLTPKMLLAGGLTQSILAKHDLSTLVNFLLVPGSYVYKHKLYEVPTSETGSLQTGLVTLFQKPKLVRFFYNVRKYFNNTPVTLKKTMRQQYALYGINEHSAQVIGHAIALNLNDDYLDEHPTVTFERIKLYIESLRENNNEISPFVYPLYGISEVCQAFVRKAAVAGAVYRLRTDVLGITPIASDECASSSDIDTNSGDGTTTDNGNGNEDGNGNENGDGDDNSNEETDSTANTGNNMISTVSTANSTMNTTSTTNYTTSTCDTGSTTNTDTASACAYRYTVKISPRDGHPLHITCKALITNILHVPFKQPTSKHIVRATLIVDGPVPILKNVPSAQILFLSSGLSRQSDVFVLVLGHRECVAPKGYKVVLISYVKEGDDDCTLSRIEHLFGNVTDRFVREERVYTCERRMDKWYVVGECDESMHVENDMVRVMDTLRRMKEDGFDVSYDL